jgi:hypothetical protein
VAEAGGGGDLTHKQPISDINHQNRISRIHSFNPLARIDRLLYKLLFLSPFHFSFALIFNEAYICRHLYAHTIYNNDA